MVIRAKVRRIGSSFGVILPKRELDARRIREDDIIEIPRINREAPRDLFGTWKDRPHRAWEPAP